MEEGINIAMRELIPQAVHYGKVLLVSIILFLWIHSEQLPN